MSDSPPDDYPSKLASTLHQTLTTLAQNPYPYIPNPPSCKKRASVALILRIRPSHAHYPSWSEATSLDPTKPVAAQLETFFAQPWVQHGDPEIVFIKRAAREGDRWTSHVALPGGKRDPEDEDDKTTAVRETVEEIGLDLKGSDALFVGNLPERVVSTSWGKVPLMVLCPFLFIYTRPDIPPLKLQPTEVASTHVRTFGSYKLLLPDPSYSSCTRLAPEVLPWQAIHSISSLNWEITDSPFVQWVPLRVLLSPLVRTYEYVDVTDRFARQGGILMKMLIRSVLGKMRFSAIRLIPSESLYCSITAEFFSPPESSNEQTHTRGSIASRLYKWYLGDHAGSASRGRPLLLWGLTLGILADFLDQLPPHNAVKLWSYPTFTSPDTRLIIDILSRNLKARNKAKLHGSGLNQTAMDSETEATAVPSGDNPWFIGGLSGGMKCDKGNGKNAGKEYAVGVMLEGYYDMARRGVWISAAARLVGTLALLLYILRRVRRRT